MRVNLKKNGCRTKKRTINIEKNNGQFNLLVGYVSSTWDIFSTFALFVLQCMYCVILFNLIMSNKLIKNLFITTK